MGEIADALRRASDAPPARRPSPPRRPTLIRPAEVAEREPSPARDSAPAREAAAAPEPAPRRDATAAPEPAPRPEAAPAPEVDPTPRSDAASAPDASAPTAEAVAIDKLAPQASAIVLERHASWDACRHLAMHVQSQLAARGARTVAVTSALGKEGRTTAACNLAIALASLGQGRRVALVDLDLRTPSMAASLGIVQGCGIEKVLRGGVALEAARVSVRHPALDVYPAREPQRAAHALLVLTSYVGIMQRLSQHYDVVVIDTPPCLLVPDTSLILAHVDACIPIARAGRTRTRTFRKMLDLLPGERILGGLLNGARAPQEDVRDHDARPTADRDGAVEAGEH
jgi:Mrp family chromosome partitioning ATPase